MIKNGLKNQFVARLLKQIDDEKRASIIMERMKKQLNKVLALLHLYHRALLYHFKYKRWLQSFFNFLNEHYINLVIQKKFYKLD